MMLESVLFLTRNFSLGSSFPFSLLPSLLQNIMKYFPHPHEA